MDISQQILEGLLYFSQTSDANTIIQKYGNGLLDQRGFTSLAKTINPAFQDQQISRFYSDTLNQFRAQSLTPFVLNQLIKRAMILKNIQRSPKELMELLAKSIQNKHQELGRAFLIFDFDADKKLEETEFRCLLEYNIPTITPQEYRNLRSQYSTPRVDEVELGRWLQMEPSKTKPRPIGIPDKFSNDRPQNSPMGSDMKPKSISTYDNKTNNNNNNKTSGDSKFNNNNNNNNTIDKNPPQHHNANPFHKAQSIVPVNDVVEVDLAHLKGLPEFQNLQKQLQSSKQKFQDPAFPPNNQSLGNEAQGYSWKRLSEIWGEEFQMFTQEENTKSDTLGEWINPDDIEQGELGDCYFLSTLSSLAAKWPEVVQSLFITQEINEQCLYGVRLCIDGIWQIITLDDFVPVKNNQPAFSHSKEKEGWVLLLEKAWAKAFGSYSNIIAGDSREVFKSIMGGPTWLIRTEQKDFQEQFMNYVKSDCLMTVGTHAQGKNYESLGLVPGHAYSILDTKQLQGNLTLVQIRNPWGKSEWKGDWSDKSSKWTPQLRQQLGEEDKDDGIFYMEMKDLINYFNTIFIAYFKTSYMYGSLPVKSKKKNSIYFACDVPTDGDYYVAVHQPSSRHFKDKYQNYKYSPIRIMMALRKSEGVYVYEDSANQSLYDACAGNKLKAGTYVIQAKVGWLYNDEGEFVISSYGPENTEFSQIKKNKDFINSVLTDKARRNPELKPLSNDCPQVYTCSEMDMKTGFGYFYYINKSQKTLELTCNLNINGIKLRKPERGNQYKIVVPPNGEKIISATVKPEGFSLSSSFSYGMK